MFKFNFGDEVEDIITGYRGLVITRSKFITGCDRYYVRPTKLTKEGKFLEGESFDENTLKLVSEKYSRSFTKINKPTFTFDTGDEVKNEPSGFKGIITGLHNYHDGSTRYSVRSSKKIKDEIGPSHDFTDMELTLVKKDKLKLNPVVIEEKKPTRTVRTGGPETIHHRIPSK